MIRTTNFDMVIKTLNRCLDNNERDLFNGYDYSDCGYWMPIHRKRSNKTWKKYKRSLKAAWEGSEVIKDEYRFNFITECISYGTRLRFLKSVWDYVSAEDAYNYIVKNGYEETFNLDDYLRMLRELKADGVVRGVRSDVKYVYQLRTDDDFIPDKDKVYWTKDWIHALDMRILVTAIRSKYIFLLRTEIKDDFILMESVSEGFILDYDKMAGHKIEFIRLSEVGNETWKEYKE